MNTDCFRQDIVLFTPDLTPFGIENGRGITGFSLMVDEYARLLAKSGKNVVVSCSSLKNPDTKINDEYLLLKRTLWRIVRYARVRDWKYAFLYFIRARKLSRATRFQIFKQRLSTGLYIRQIRDSKATVAFIQSFLPHIMPFVGASLSEKLPMALVCHAAYDDKSPLFCNYGGSFARYAVAPLVMNGISVSGVGSGIVKYFQQHIPIRYYPQLHLIGNPLPVVIVDALRNEKVTCGYTIVVSGNIGERKNQSQVLRSLAMLPAETKRDMQVIFIGNDTTNGKIQQEAKELGVDDLCYFTGQLQRSEALRITANADLVVSATCSEGFGMPFIEGFAFGIPAVSFADIDAAEELGDPECMVLVKERSDKALADGILKAMQKEWDRNYIRQMVISKFDSQVITEKYIHLLDSTPKPTLSEERWDKMMLVYLRNKEGCFYPESR